MSNSSPFIVLVALLATGHLAQAQPASTPARRPAAVGKATLALGDSSGTPRGTAWEYKVIDRKKKETVLKGEFVVAKNSVFAVVDQENEPDRSASSEKVADPVGDKKRSKRDAKKLDKQNQPAQKTETAQSRKPRRLAKSEPRTERIGEIVTGKKTKSKRNLNQYTFRFDKEDAHKLSGVAVVKRDAKQVGVWVGHYNDTSKKRWRFELRKIDREVARTTNSRDKD